jgi:hypothetical protein
MTYWSLKFNNLLGIAYSRTLKKDHRRSREEPPYRSEEERNREVNH